MIEQQNGNTAYTSKKFALRNVFEKDISGFLHAFSIDDVEKYDLCTKKKIQNIFFIVLTTTLKHMEVKKENKTHPKGQRFSWLEKGRRQ